MTRTPTAAPRLAALGVVLTAGLTACGSGAGAQSTQSTLSAQQPSRTPAQSTPATVEPTGEQQAAGALPHALEGKKVDDHGTEDVTGLDTVDVTMHDFYFEPTVLLGTPGQTLTVELENEGSAVHTFSVPSQDVDAVVSPGDRAEVTVTFPDSGSIVVACRFHAAQGMRGALAVSG